MVERPVSIVKELVENSIDAQSSAITIEIVNGGKSLIRVSDDGIGMSKDDALLAIERYATSKIYTKADLFSISTMGFRGEALPSIASVSKLSLVTRTKQEDTGTRIEMAGGRINQVSDAGAPVGTLVEVKSLFYNTPARKKFLKSDQTETYHVADAVFGMALGHPDIRFRLFVDQKLQKNFALSDDLFQRAVRILGKEASDRLYPFEFCDDSFIRIHGVCSNPSLTRSSASRIYLYVNHRLIHDRGLISAIFKGYRGRLMKGRFPVGAFFIEIAYDQVDVNVHPSKREIKFFNGQRAYQAMATAVEQALSRAQQDMSVYTRVTADEDYQKPDVSQPVDRVEEPPGESAGRIHLKQQGIDSQRLTQSDISWAGPAPEKNDTPKEKTGQDLSITGGGATIRYKGPSQNNLKIIGQVMGTYIVAESDQGLVMIDQHAAHERIVYEKLKSRYRSLTVQSQQLLVPQTLEFNYKEFDLVKSLLPDLEAFGFAMEPFGGTTVVIKAVPAIIENQNIQSIIMEMIENMLTKKDGLSKEKWLDDCLMLMACHTAIRAGQQLHLTEIQALLADLEECENSRHCPHGRPVMIFWNKEKIEKLFKRIV